MSAIRILASHVNLIDLLSLSHPEGDSIKKKKRSKYDAEDVVGEVKGVEACVWTPWDKCDAYASKRGYFMKRSGKPDTHRAGLELLRDTLDGVIPFYVVPSKMEDLDEEKQIEKVFSHISLFLFPSLS